MKSPRYLKTNRTSPKGGDGSGGVNGERKGKSETTGITTPLATFIDSLPYCFVMRVNSGGVRVRNGYMHLAPEGTPDIHATIKSVSAWFETKLKGKKPTAVQLKRHEQITRAGGIVFVVDSLEQGKVLVMNLMRPGWQRPDDGGRATVSLDEIVAEFGKAAGT